MLDKQTFKEKCLQKKYLFVILALVLMASNVTTSALAGPSNLPSQQYWVTDDAYILGKRAAYSLTKNAQKHEKNTSDQLVTLIVETLDGWHINDYVKWVGNEWEIGQEGKNNGVLLLIATQDRKVRIEVGRGLEGVITPSIAQSIIDNEILPHFKLGDTEEGIISGHKTIIKALDGKYVKRAHTKMLWLLLVFPWFFFGEYIGLDRSTSLDVAVNWIIPALLEIDC